MSGHDKEDLVKIQSIEDDKNELHSVTNTLEKVKLTCKIGSINGEPMTDDQIKQFEEDQIKQFEEDWKNPEWVACYHLKKLKI